MSFFRKQWKLHLYLNGVYVGKTTIKPNEKPQDNIYVVHFWFKKQIFRTNHVKCVIHPTRLLYGDDKKKITCWSFEYEKGAEL